jgi:glycosyltransferase involved in cell wall biosynthesis
MELQVHDLLESLALRGHRVTMVTTRSIREVTSHYTVLSSPESPPGRSSRQFSAFAYSAVSALIQTKPVIVLGVSIGAEPTIDMLRSNHVPLLVQCHGTGRMEVESQLRVKRPRNLAAAAVISSRIPRELKYLQSAGAIVAVGRRVGASLVGWPYADNLSDSLHMIPNGIHEGPFLYSRESRAEIRSWLQLDPSTLLCLFVGRYVRQKGWRDAVRIVQQLRTDRPAALLLVGDGPEAGLVRSTAETLSGIFLTRAAGRVEVARFMSAADVLLFPTKRSEGLPLVVLEAAASGLRIAAPGSVLDAAGLDGVRLAGDLRYDAEMLRHVAPSESRDSYLPSENRHVNSVDQYEVVIRSLTR